MPTLTIATDQKLYRVSPDDPVPAAGLLRALISGQILDELTADPLRVQPHPEVFVEEPGFSVQVKADGVFAIAAVPRHRFPFLATQAYEVHVTVQALGYVPLKLAAQIVQTPLFPSKLPALVDLGPLPLHRQPVLIAGRVVRKVPPFVPVVGATVRVTGIWPVLPPPNSAPPPDSPSLIALRASLYSPRNPATATALPVTLSAVAGQAKRLPLGAAAGGAALSLSNRLGLNLAGGDVLWIDPGTSAEEFIQTTKVQGASTATQPSEAQLAHALRHHHESDTAVEVATSLTPPGAAKPLTRPAITGDAVIFLSDLTGWSAATAAKIDDGVSTEYHATSHFTATTDAGGFYRLPPISRVVQVALAAQGPSGTQAIELSIDYSQPINHVDFHL
jgi:hypothetical protein